MRVEFKSAIMDAIQFNNNYEEVIEWVEEHYGDGFTLEFNWHEKISEHPYIEIILCPNFIEDIGSTFAETHIVDLYDYLVILPTGELSLYDELTFNEMFNEVS